jgi:peptide/nickel transport system substrate-binding protein
MQPHRSGVPELTRREAIAVAGGGTVFASGCADNSSSDDGQTAGDDSAGQTYHFPITGHATSKEAIQFNNFNLTNAPWWGSQRFLFAFLSVLSSEDFEWYPLSATEMEVTDDEWRIELVDALEWHTGDPVTAEDYVRQLKLSAYMQQRISNYVGSPSAIASDGEYSMRISLDDTYNPDALRANVLTQNGIMAPEPVFGEYLERFEDATTESERDTVRNDLGQFGWNDPEPHTCGPLKLEAVTTQGMRLTPYSGYPTDVIRENLPEENAGSLPSMQGKGDTEYSGRFYQSNNSVTQAVISGRIDGGAGMNPKTESDIARYPESGEVRTQNQGYGISILFNLMDDEDASAYRDRRVRKAFAHIIDFDGVAQQFFGDFGDHRPRFSGLAPTMEEKLFDDSFLESLDTYEQDFDRAEALLEDAGFTHDGQWWKKPDGSVLTPTFKGPTSVQYYVSGFQVAVSNLKEFGIKAELNAIEGTSFFSKTIPNLDYGLTRGYYGHSTVPIAWRNSWVRYDGPEDKDYAAYLQKPHDSTVLEVPPIGEPDSDETIEIDVLDRFNAVRHAREEERIRHISKELAWAFNQTVPRLPVSTAPFHWYLDHDDWNYPPSDSPLGRPGNGLVWMLPQYGGIQPK